MSLQPILDQIFTRDEAVQSLQFLRKYGSRCSTILEFGTRGGVSGVAFLKTLQD
jgi:predicted O-methyltransferase YrrM